MLLGGKLKDHNIVDYKRDNSRKVIYINPMFSNRSLKSKLEIFFLTNV